MARRDALLRLHQRLLARRDALRKILQGELNDLGSGQRKDAMGDAADFAFDTGSGEISSQLAELEARELAQVERALERLRQGTYGICESCGKRIPVARLNALPYSTYCIGCQRQLEANPDWRGLNRSGENWAKVYEAESALEQEDKDVDLSEIEMDIGNGGR
jgi:DnaK suppressor protein